MNRDRVTDMLKRAGDETDPVQRGLLLAEAQVMASLCIMDRLEDILSQAELIGANSI